MQQPSAQGIASLYRGNPQPLQQQIQKDQQAKPGLPPDLQKMLALQIVTNEKDAAAASTAMQQLKQMSAPAGQMPTVMQSLEQQAQQKMQAQQQPPMGGMMAQAPQDQGQGIDQLPAEFSMAGGGIVAFNGEKRSDVPDEYETAYDRMTRKNREDAERPERKTDDEGIRKALAYLAAPLAAAGDVVAAPFRGLYGVTQHGNTSLTPLMDARARFLASSENAPAAESAAREVAGDQKPQAVPPAGNREALNRADAGIRSAPAEKAAPRPAVNDLVALARQKQQVAPPPPPAQVAPKEDSQALQILKQQMMAKPEDREAAEITKYKAAVPAPDTTQHDRLIAELENRKQALNPKQGYEGLMEYLSDISRAGQDPRTRGRGSFASGAAGATLSADRAKENQLQQFELSKQAIEVSQKKLDTVRAYAEKTYGIGKSAFDQVYKDRHDAAKEVVKDEAGAARLAKEETLKLLEMKNAKEIAAGHDATSLAAAKLRTDGGGDKQQLNELKALQKQYTDQMKTTFNAAERAALKSKLSAVEAEIAKMAGVGTMPGAPGAGSPGGTRPPLSSFQR